jgi:signal transduction histidine kinase
LRDAAEDEALRERLNLLERATREGLAETLHELKAPLHTAAGFIDLVADELAGPLNEQQRDFLKTAQGEYARVKDALGSAVELGALAAERPLDMERVEPEGVVDLAIERHRGQAVRRDVRVIASVDPNAQPVRADAAALQQVLANFLQNALRLVPAGSEIVVSAAPMGGATCFAVADRGPGLAEADLATIFEPYRQPGASAARQVGNVGLGLSIARKIVEQHNGRIWAENRADGQGGSRFCFTLPGLIHQLVPRAAA